MCQKKPGARCTPHAKKSLESATARLQKTWKAKGKDSPEFQKAHKRWEQAKKNYESTPGGIKDLEAKAERFEKMGETDKAEKYRDRAEFNRAIRKENLRAHREAQEFQKEAEKHQAAAAEAHKRTQESWERSDTDGFLSQHASSLSARVSEAKAEIARNNGRAEFPALFDLEGNIVPAKLVNTAYGRSWGLLSDPEDPRSSFTGWVSPSKANDPERAKKNMEKKGYRVGTVSAPANAALGSPEGATGMSGLSSVYVDIYRTDGGFSKDVEVVDNGE